MGCGFRKHQIGGVDVKELAFADFNRKIAYVAQDNYLFNETVRENIRQGNPDATDEQIIEVTKKSGCYEFIMQLENGFDTVVGGAGGHLSGGERQRISIARAMLKDAPIVILMRQLPTQIRKMRQFCRILSQNW